ncbi:hypothetical protein E2C01_017462 [Portunus trituberculatus]|uniref:Uncharacterized protein n=1 Tax=Portunus trituberculatus TaxID=210409 RepID=A0A5B7DRX8_PORTR|nr:hypothetical protein [Portunus trituberculatus]
MSVTLPLSAVGRSRGRDSGIQSNINTVSCASLNVRIYKHIALSPRLFSRATEMISGVFKRVSPVNNAEILSNYR